MQLNPTTSEKRTGYVNRNGIVSWSFVKKKRNKEHVRSKTMSRRPNNQCCYASARDGAYASALVIHSYLTRSLGLTGRGRVPLALLRDAMRDCTCTAGCSIDAQ